MKRGLLFVSGVGLGAGLMYVFDPDRGMRRRALLRDKARHVINETGRAIENTSHDVGNRARGVIAEAQSFLRREQVSDAVLIERVRSRIGRAVSRPKNVEIHVNNGYVTLRGVVGESEVPHLLKCVSRVHGVTEIENQLKINGHQGAVGETQH